MARVRQSTIFEVDGWLSGTGDITRRKFVESALAASFGGSVVPICDRRNERCGRIGTAGISLIIRWQDDILAQVRRTYRHGGNSLCKAEGARQLPCLAV